MNRPTITELEAILNAEGEAEVLPDGKARGKGCDDPKGRVVDETSRDVLVERCRCVGIVIDTIKRLPDEPRVRCVLLDLIKDMEARRLADIRETVHGNR